MNSYLLTAYQKQYYQEILQVPKGVKQGKYIDGWVIFEANDIYKLRKAFHDRLSPAYIEFLVSKSQKECDRLKRTAQEIRAKEPYKNMSDNELLALFTIYSSDVIRVMPFLAGIVILEGVLQDKLESKLKAHINHKGLSADSKSYLSKLVFPRQKSGPSQALVDLYKLGAEAKADDSLQELFDLGSREALKKMEQIFPFYRAKFDNYIKKYDFMDMEYYAGHPLNPKELFRRVKSVMDEAEEKLNQIKQDNNKAETEFKKACEKLQLSPELHRFVELTQAIHHQRQYRADALFKAGRDVFKFMKAIGKRLNLDSYEAVMALDWQEIVDSLLKGKLTVSKDTIKSRMKGWGFVLEDGNYTYITGENLEKEMKFFSKREEDVVKLEGQPVFPGTYQGKVTIVTLPDEIDKVEKGDIIVSPMTDPYYLPAMVKAGAIITDEGGILSHAAIVSRELGVPGVIGTKNATKVLKDGDLVEVDADEGIVRILKSTNS